MEYANQTTSVVNSGAINSFISNPISMFVIAIILFVVVVWLFNKKGKDKWFKPVPLSTILKDQNAKLLKVTILRGYWGYLRHGDISLGKILKVGRLNYITENPEYKKPRSKEEREEVLNDPAKQKHIEKQFYIIKVSFNPQGLIISPFVFILEAFGIGVKYAFVPEEITRRFTIEGVGMAKANMDYICISPEVQVINLANVYIYGYYAFKLFKDMALFYQREKELEELVNYPKRVVYLDSGHAKRTDLYEELDRIEKDRFNRKVKNLSGDSPR